MRQNEVGFENERDYRMVIAPLQDIVSRVRQSVSMRLIKTPADFIVVMETLRLCGVSITEAGNTLAVPSALVHNWQNGQQLPPRAEYHHYATLATELLRIHLILFAGRRWSLAPQGTQ